MKITFKNIPKFLEGGYTVLEGGISTVDWTNPESTWYTRAGNKIILLTYTDLKELYDKWKKTGSPEDREAFENKVKKLNDDLEQYAILHNEYVNNGNKIFTNRLVKPWLNKIISNYGYVNDAIGNVWDLYRIHSKNPNTGDRFGLWTPDGYWAGITHDRTPWGYLNSREDKDYKYWKDEFRKIGIDYRTSTTEDGDNVLYGRLIGEHFDPSKPTLPKDEGKLSKSIINPIINKKPDIWSKIKAIRTDNGDLNSNKFSLSKFFSNPNLWSSVRLGLALNANDRIYGELLKGIRPVLRQSYNTHSLVLGDEATKQSFYRRGIQGLTKASRPFTSDADRQMAYQMEAKRAADELKAQGDLADNLEIRRTSAEANQHMWANTQRATEVANANIASMLLANAAKHNLLALKHAANYSSIDNYLLGLETENKLKQNQLKALDLQIALLNIDDYKDEEYYLKYQHLLDILKKNTTEDGNIIYTPELLKAQSEWNEFLKSLLSKRFQAMRDSIASAKSGIKLTHKRKDDLLYKTARDTVEHFRKMSKLLDESSKKKSPKIEKLTSHPKGNTRKYLYGGTAPFVVYKPAALGGETTTTSQRDTSNILGTSKKSEKGTDVLDVIKNLFQNLEGLPSDVNGIYKSMLSFLSKLQFFGNEITSEDLASMYLLQILKINTIKFNKKYFDDVYKNAETKDALLEFAVDGNGRIAAQNMETGKISFMRWEDIKKNLETYNPLTNGLLLNQRAYSPDLAFNKNILELVSNYGIGMSKIAEFLKSLLPKLGSSENTIEGYTKQDSNIIKAGLQLLSEAPPGDYKFTQYTKDLLKQANAALNYLASILPNNMKTVLKVHADMNGISVGNMLQSLISSTMDENSKLEFDAVTGKAAKDSTGANKDNSDGLKLDAATALIYGKGYNTEIELNPGSSYAIKANGRFSEFLKSSGENMGSGITMKLATASTLSGVLDWNKATIGGSKIIPTGYDLVIINNGEVVGIDLIVNPSDQTKPDFERMKLLENLDKLLKLKGIENSDLNWRLINEICEKIGIPPKYDSNGELNKSQWKRFAAFQVTIPDTVLVDKNVILDMVGIAGENERDLYNLVIQQNTNNKKFELSDTFLGFIGHRDELYKGTVFIPIKENGVAAAISGGQNISMILATNLQLKELGYDNSKISTYKKPELSL